MIVLVRHGETTANRDQLLLGRADPPLTARGIRLRREAGFADTMRMVAKAPWRQPSDPIEGVIEHL